MRELDRAGNTERRESADVLRRQALGVLDPLAQAQRLPGVPGGLERVECLAVRAVPDGVNGDGPAGVVGDVVDRGLQARAPARMTSASSSPLVMQTPEPSSSQAVCEPSVPSMNAFR